MPSLRRAVILMLCALIAVGIGGLAVLDPFHLRYARWFTIGAVTLAILLVTAAFAAVARRGLLRGAVLVVGGVALVGWVAVAWLAATLGAGSTDVAQIDDDGGRRLVVLESVPVIDPAYAVVVRSGGGPFEQQSTVYQGPEGGPQPEARFLDADTVVVETPDGCNYQSEIEPITLDVGERHAPPQADGC
jgi:hypothetical protein